ncbi:MAG: adenylate/guanylate cyclase domain-containing protein [Acidobacteriota bacterium]
MSERAPILYVDDEESALVIFSAAFQTDYELHLASSAQEALDILRRTPIHLVVTDQRMPGTTGVQLLEVIKAELPHVVRMILTGFSDVDTVLQAINSGRVHHYATKPWKPKELRIAIDRALEGYELRRRNQQLMEQLKQKVAREREIRRAFQRFAPAEVVDALIDSRGQNPLPGELRIVAALYCDVHGFHDLSLRLPATRVVAFLNAYLGVVHGIVARHQGTMVDNGIAVFGAPKSSMTNADNAVGAAVEILSAIEEFNRRKAPDLLGEAISMGIGIHFGEAITGNLGAEEKMEYSVIGEAVDVAARLWELTKDDANGILITRSTLDRTRHLVDAVALEPVVLRGRDQPIEVFRVAQPKGSEASGSLSGTR